jgi:hypothetical protein
LQTPFFFPILIEYPINVNKRFSENEPVLSVHWELRTLLYLGVFLLSGGLGIWVYKNLDAIDRLAIVAALALVSAGSFALCWRRQAPYWREKVSSSGVVFDYVLLLGCLTFVTLVSYLQYQYALFGPSLRLAGLIPLLVLAFSAYYFDHLGVLSLAITNLGAWLGIVVTPREGVDQFNVGGARLDLTGLLLGLFLVLTAVWSRRTRIKPHFWFTYMNFGVHIGFISCLALLFQSLDSYVWPAWLAILLAAAWWLYRISIQEKSFYFLVVLTLYSYIGISAGACKILWVGADIGGVLLMLMYFIGSGIGAAYFLIRQNQKMKAHDRLQS